VALDPGTGSDALTASKFADGLLRLAQVDLVGPGPASSEPSAMRRGR
jgi:hypothetical protein